MKSSQLLMVVAMTFFAHIAPRWLVIMLFVAFFVAGNVMGIMGK